MAQVIMPEKRRSNFDEILQTVMAGVSIADKVYGIKASQASSEASIATKLKAEKDAKQAEQDRQNAAAGILSTKEAAEIGKSMQIQFDRPFEDGEMAGLPVKINTPNGVQQAYIRVPPKPAEKKQATEIKTRVVETVDESGNVVQMIVEDKPGQIFKAAPKEKPKPVSAAFEKIEIERQEQAEAAARSFKNLEKKLDKYSELRKSAFFTGPIAGRAGAIASLVGTDVGDASELDVNLLGDLTDYIKQTSGSAASDAEVDRLKKIMPGLSDSEDLFDKKMERLRETARVIAQEKIDAYTSFKNIRDQKTGQKPQVTSDQSANPQSDMVRMVNPKTGERVKVPRGMIGEAAKDGFMEVQGG
jgi:hypothetical protein